MAEINFNSITLDKIEVFMLHRFNHFFTVLLILIGLSLLIFMTNADLGLVRLVALPNHQWPGMTQQPWPILYKLAPIPGLILGVVALTVFVAGYLFSFLKGYRREALFVVLLLALGPGLVVNVILKNHLGRPRPQELIEFGGHYQFVQSWQRGTTGKNSSFPSGHASIAFFLIAPWFFLHRKRPGPARLFLFTGILFGLLVGIGRIEQGAHFPSDILWAGGLVYLTGEILSCFFRFDICRQEQDSTNPVWKNSCRREGQLQISRSEMAGDL